MDGVSDDLVNFLHARLDEDEQTARAASGPSLQGETWVAQRHPLHRGGPVLAAVSANRFKIVESEANPWDIDTAMAQVTHMARHDPARVLAEVEAKRYVIDQCAYWNERATREAIDPPKWPQPGLELGLLLDAMNPVLRGLALPYADHPDYRDEWRPS